MDEQNTNENIMAPKNNNKKYIIIAIVVIAVLVIGSLFNNFIGRMTGEKLAENILESKLGGDVDINSSDGSVSINTKDGSFSAGSSVKWPSDMPSDIPQFTSGKLTMAGSALTGSKGWQVAAIEVEKDNFTAYHNLIKSNGWVDDSVFESGISIIQMTKGGVDLLITYNGEERTFTLVASIK